MSTVDAPCDLDARAQRALVARGEVSPSELLEAHLARIEQVNPRLNAIVTLDVEGARTQARHLDRLVARHAELPLLGLPLAVKDLAATRGMRTTMGSPIYRDFVPDYDELFVERLRAAGANIIGKTNTPEFGAGSQTFNPVFGATLNPYDPSRTCGGSSGGAAVALATGMIPLADGSDLGGSLRNPAAFCNVVGLRPSPGRVPSWPKQFSSDALAVHGPMARNVADCAWLLSVMAGPDPRVPISLAEDGASFRRDLARDFRGRRVAWSADLGGYPVDRRITAVLEAALPQVAALGCEVEAATPDLSDADDIFRTLRAWMFLARGREDYTRHREQMKDTLRWNIEQGLALTAADISRAEVARSALVARVARFFDDYDFLLCPATQVPPFPVEQEWVREIEGVELATYLDWMGVCCAITVTGLPAISVPAGFTAEGLPVGLQIVGRRWADFELLQFAHAFEQASGHGRRRPPRA
ncbi:MAG: amidase [Gammaproteobacteria bacterium]|nr:amidase [Gammaproteobacteria bacterium]